MYFPKSIKIFGVNYKINTIDDNNVLDSRNDGCLNFRKQAIYISKNYPIEQQYKILLHEILHAISNDLFLNFDEQLTEQLATSLFAVLSDNKLLRK